MLLPSYYRNSKPSQQTHQFAWCWWRTRAVQAQLNILWIIANQPKIQIFLYFFWQIFRQKKISCSIHINTWLHHSNLSAIIVMAYVPVPHEKMQQGKWLFLTKSKRRSSCRVEVNSIIIFIARHNYSSRRLCFGENAFFLLKWKREKKMQKRLSEEITLPFPKIYWCFLCSFLSTSIMHVLHT